MVQHSRGSPAAALRLRVGMLGAGSAQRGSSGSGTRNLLWGHGESSPGSCNRCYVREGNETGTTILGRERSSAGPSLSCAVRCRWSQSQVLQQKVLGFGKTCFSHNLLLSCCRRRVRSCSVPSTLTAPLPSQPEHRDCRGVGSGNIQGKRNEGPCVQSPVPALRAPSLHSEHPPSTALWCLPQAGGTSTVPASSLT